MSNLIQPAGEYKQMPPERRIGRTGIWTFVMETGDGKILATSGWGTNYEFTKAYWHALLIAP